MFRRYAPSAESLRSSRWMRWLGPRASEPQAWRLDRRRVARGVAIGAVAAVLIPLGQIPLAVFAAFLLRASPLAAAMTTFISNPLTIGPIYIGAYELGAMLLRAAGLHAAAPAVPETSTTAWLMGGLLTHGAPLLLGVPLLAAIAGAIGYCITQYIWRRRVLARRAAGRTGTKAVAAVPSVLQLAERAD